MPPSAHSFHSAFEDRFMATYTSDKSKTRLKTTSTSGHAKLDMTRFTVWMAFINSETYVVLVWTAIGVGTFDFGRRR